MNYRGVIIEESLINNSIINEFKIIQKEIELVTEKEGTPWLDKWTLYTVEIDEKSIEEYAQKLSKLLDMEHCSDWYCDFRNDKFHYVVFSNKVFKLDRNNKQDYINMQNYAISIGLPKHQLPDFNDLPINLLIGFLLDAKKQTYANNNAKKINSSRLGSNDYEYEAEIEGEIMRYHDTYFGGTKFIGEEVVYRGSNLPKWGMNYYGVTFDENISEEAMDKALRPALMNVGKDNSVLPVRGPSNFENEGYTYTFKTEGTIENFIGVEQIFKDNKLVYKLNCHGGLIE